MKNRWAVAAAGTMAMVCLGTVYSWSLFTQPLIASFGWSNETTTWTFAYAILFLGIGAVIGGRWQDRAGPRAVVVTGALLWGLGNVLAGLGTARFGPWWMRGTYGILGGIGLGLGYVTPVATVTKWFPDRRGLAGGLVVMGFGLGAFFYNNILTNIPAFAAVVEAARGRTGPSLLAPEQVSTLMMTFVVSGVAFILVGGTCAYFVTNPPTTGQAGPAGPASVPTGRQDFRPADAERTFQIYSMWLMLFLNVTAGILVISNAVPIIRELTGAPATQAAKVYGFLALFNGLGRFFWGAVSDRIGRNFAYVLIYGIQAVIFIMLGYVHGMAAVASLFAVVLLCYGGGFGTMPSFTADYFGTRFMGLIYGWILLAWGVAGVVGPIFAARVKDLTGSFGKALPYVAAMLLAATVLPLVTRRPRRGEAIAAAAPADLATIAPSSPGK
jgi:MFS family permease